VLLMQPYAPGPPHIRLDGGVERGLVAIDPAPCRGDPAFDAVDPVYWRADDVDTIARIPRRAPVVI
jgi:streptomycin 6-kinase